MGAGPPVLVRADASTSIGVGHVMRCITLIGALSDAGARPVLASRELPERLRRRAEGHGAQVIDLEPDGVLVDVQSRLVVVDGYGLGAEVTASVASGATVTIIDDNGELPTAGVRRIVNQNLHATPALYGRAPGPQLLLGPEYALIRRDVTGSLRDDDAREGHDVLVALGGSDPLRLTAVIVDALLDATDAVVRVAPGLVAPESSAAGTRADRVIVDGSDLVEAFACADLAIIGAGSTMWEVGRRGIPAIALVVAENQVAGSAAAQRLGFVRTIDVRTERSTSQIAAVAADLLDDPTERAAMAAAGRSWFDGHGAARVTQAILSDW